jgi:hypothetical protein
VKDAEQGQRGKAEKEKMEAEKEEARTDQVGILPSTWHRKNGVGRRRGNSVNEASRAAPRLLRKEETHGFDLLLD